MPESTFDYIIVGGGNAGCVVASRLSQALLNFIYPVEKFLSGGSAANYGTWVRGYETDFNEWGSLVGDERKSETHFRKEEDLPNASEHGFHGPIHTTTALQWPLGPTVKKGFLEAGVTGVADANSGQSPDLARCTENWRDGIRQPAGLAYDMSKVHVMTNTLVHKVLLEKTGTSVKAKGPSQLKGARIESLIDPPYVGKNLHDHPAMMIPWKPRHPEKRLVFGATNFPNFDGNPNEWIYTAIPVPGAGETPEQGSVFIIGGSCFLPKSRGSVKISSTNALDHPIIDPNCLGTDHDRCIMRSVIRFAMKVMNTNAAKEELDAFIRPYAITWFHPARTAAMGAALDTECRVKGVESLRVVDVSILPLPISAHYQATVYALAEQAAEDDLCISMKFRTK
ncbi:hypothetical protein B0J14DRAFT_625474 [Halenospora varia]|nr:hypothetical protein B0J14DRAFT_625474 [Halenospora varia]